MNEKTIGRYELLDLIGKGAMGTVYRARHRELENVVAVKILHPKYSENRKFIDRFISEARASGRLSHPNVVRGIDAGETGGRYFFVMEFVDGPPLDEIIRKEGRIDENRALKITLDIARALDHAAENRVVHRDVKPANILVGSDGRAKLADLGLASRLDVDEKKPGAAMGTPDYISPEQIQAYPDVDIRTDIYSLGITLYQMLTGKLPYSGSAEDVMTKHLTDPIPDPLQHAQGLSPDTMRILRKMTEKSRVERYQSPRDLVEDLLEALAGGGVAVRQASRSLASRRIDRGSRISPASAAVVVGVALVAAAIGFVVVKSGSGGSGQGQQKKNAPSEAPKPRVFSEIEKADETTRQASDALDKARASFSANPSDYDAAIAGFEEVRRRFGADWADSVAAEIAIVRTSRETDASAGADAALAAAGAHEAAGRFAEARAIVADFVRESRVRFRTTAAFERAAAAEQALKRKLTEESASLVEEASRKLNEGDFAGARDAVSRLRRIDPVENGKTASELAALIDKTEAAKRDAEDERRGMELLAAAREKAAPLVLGFKNAERIKEAFDGVRSATSSARVLEEAAMEIRDLDRLQSFVQALFEAKAAAGSEFTVSGKTGRIASVSGGYVHLDIGRARTAFKVQDMKPEEVARLADLGLASADAQTRRGLAVYLLYAGMNPKALAVIEGLGLTKAETDFYKSRSRG